MNDFTTNNDGCKDGRARSLANLRSWKPGQSGNPRGRARGSVNLTNAILRVLKQVAAPDKQKRKWAEFFAERLVTLACEGNAAAIREVLARVDGPAPTGADGGGGIGDRLAAALEGVDAKTILLERLAVIRERTRAALPEPGGGEDHDEND